MYKQLNEKQIDRLYSLFEHAPKNTSYIEKNNFLLNKFEKIINAIITDEFKNSFKENQKNLFSLINLLKKTSKEPKQN